MSRRHRRTNINYERDESRGDKSPCEWTRKFMNTSGPIRLALARPTWQQRTMHALLSQFLLCAAKSHINSAKAALILPTLTALGSRYGHLCYKQGWTRLKGYGVYASTEGAIRLNKRRMVGWTKGTQPVSDGLECICAHVVHFESPWRALLSSDPTTFIDKPPSAKRSSS